MALWIDLLINNKLKMKRLIGFIFVVISLISCNRKPDIKNEGYKQLVSDSIICDALNYFVNNDSIDEFKYSKRFVDKEVFCVLQNQDSLKLTKLDSIFTKEDLDFIFKQNRNAVYFKHKYLKNKVLIPSDTLMKFGRREFWKEFHKRLGEGGFCSISMPLFSKKMNIVIIKYSYSCGRLCASGGTFIYKRINNKWVEIYCIHSWIS